MIPYLMTRFILHAEHIVIPLHVLSDRKKRCSDSVFLQNIENFGSIYGVRTVIKGKCDVFGVRMPRIYDLRTVCRLRELRKNAKNRNNSKEG